MSAVPVAIRPVESGSRQAPAAVAVESGHGPVDRVDLFPDRARPAGTRRGAHDVDRTGDGPGQGALSRAAARVPKPGTTSTASTASSSSTSAPPSPCGSARAVRPSSPLGQAWSEKQRTIIGALDRFEASLCSTERDNTRTDEAQSAVFARTQQRLR